MIVFRADMFQNPASYTDRVDEMEKRARAIPPAEGFERVMIPGDSEVETRAIRELDGVPIVDDVWQRIVETAERTGAKVVGPVPLPTKIERFTVRRSTFIDKDSHEHFEIRTHKRLIDVMEPDSKTIDTLMRLNLPAGVDIEIKI